MCGESPYLHRLQDVLEALWPRTGEDRRVLASFKTGTFSILDFEPGKLSYVFRAAIADDPTATFDLVGGERPLLNAIASRRVWTRSQTRRERSRLANQTAWLHIWAARVAHQDTRARDDAFASAAVDDDFIEDLYDCGTFFESVAEAGGLIQEANTYADQTASLNSAERAVNSNLVLVTETLRLAAAFAAITMATARDRARRLLATLRTRIRVPHTALTVRMLARAPRLAAHIPAAA